VLSVLIFAAFPKIAIFFFRHELELR